MAVFPRIRTIALVAALAMPWGVVVGQEDSLERDAAAAMKRAAGFFRGQVAVHGGYVYHYSLDLQQRWGEGIASRDQIWVQPPGTPTVGLAYLKAFEATGDSFYLEAATAAARAIAYGQLRSGGWTNSVDFNPSSPTAAAYRNGRGRGRDTSSLDDGQTPAALRLLMHVDRALGFQDPGIHESVEIGWRALLQAQFPNGGFPQVWTGPVQAQPIKRASYPPYDWRTEGRVKNYWDIYTLNDNVTGYVAEALIDAHAIYGNERYLAALTRLGEFLLLAQMPEPQPGWAQQYNYEMQPIWARKFEPPGVSGDETQEVIATLMRVYAASSQRKYLQPIPSALAWLERSLLPDGQLARYYELQTNRPLYMTRRGDDYSLTYDDSNLPSHYGWKTPSQTASLRARYEQLLAAESPLELAARQPPTVRQVRSVLGSLDSEGRWTSTYRGERLVGQAKMPLGTVYLSSELFSSNLVLLSEFLLTARGN